MGRLDLREPYRDEDFYDDELGRGRAPAAAERRETGRTLTGCGGSNEGECTRLLPLTPLRGQAVTRVIPVPGKCASLPPRVS